MDVDDFVRILEGGSIKGKIMWIAIYFIVGIIFLIFMGFLANKGTEMKKWIWGSYGVAVLLFFVSGGLIVKQHPIFATVTASVMFFACYTLYSWAFGAKNITFADNKLFLFGTLGIGIVSGILMMFSLSRLIPKQFGI